MIGREEKKQAIADCAVGLLTMLCSEDPRRNEKKSF